MRHDATTGFQDIKAVPNFLEESIWRYLPYLLALGIIIFIVKKFFFSPKKLNKIDLVTSIYETSKKELEEFIEKLKSGEISNREFSSKASLTLRNVLEVFFNFPAKDLTFREIQDKLSIIEEKNDTEIQNRTKKILFKLDEISFSKREINTKAENIRDEILELISSYKGRS